MLRIFSNFSDVDLGRVMRVCNQWWRVAQEDSLWEAWCCRKWDVSVLRNYKSWREFCYQKNRTALRPCKSTTMFFNLNENTFAAGSGGTIAGEIMIVVVERPVLFSGVLLEFTGVECAFVGRSPMGSAHRHVYFKNRYMAGAPPIPYLLRPGRHYLSFQILIPTVGGSGEKLPGTTTVSKMYYIKYTLSASVKNPALKACQEIILVNDVTKFTEKQNE